MAIEWDEEDSERDHRRQELIESAAVLFREKGFKATTLDQIVAFTKKGKTALYYYFKNKKSIFTAVIAWEISRVYQEIEKQTLAGLSLEDLQNQDATFDSTAAIVRYVHEVVRIGETFLRKHKDILREYALFQKLIQSIIKAFKEQNEGLLRAILEHACRYKRLHFLEQEIPLVAYGIFRICFTYYSDIMQELDFQVRAEDLEAIVLLLLRPEEKT